MNILVLGASGFIGRNITEFFAAMGHKVVATGKTKKFSFRNVEFIERIDLTEKKDVQYIFSVADSIFGSPYTVIQAAATTSGAKEILGKPWYHVTDNAIMNSLILREVKEHKVENFIFFSCTVMYASLLGMASEDSFIPKVSDSYFGVGHTKLYIEKMCEFYSRFTDTNFICLRHSNVYGPYDKFDLERSHFFGANMTKVLDQKTYE